MTSERPDPGGADFLALIGEPERSAWRVALWFGLGVALSIMGFSVLGVLAHLVDPTLLEDLEPTATPMRVAQVVGLSSLSIAAVAGAFLGAARLVFQREAWSFVTPLRSFRFGLMAIGLVPPALFILGEIAIGYARGKPPTAFVLDATVDADQRAAFVGGMVVFGLLRAAAFEALFRGLLPQVVGTFLRRPLPLSLLSGAFFAVLIPHNGYGETLALFALGAGLTWSVLELGGIEYAVGVEFMLILAAAVVGGPKGIVGDEAMKAPDIAEAVALGVVLALAATGLKRFRPTT